VQLDFKVRKSEVNGEDCTCSWVRSQILAQRGVGKNTKSSEKIRKGRVEKIHYFSDH